MSGQVTTAKARSEHITLRLDEKIVVELRRVAALNDRSVSSQVRILLRDALRELAA